MHLSKGMGLFTHARPSTIDEARAAGAAVWILEDEPDAADLACDLAELANAAARAFRDHHQYLAALDHEPPPALVVLDWRLERELASPVFLATRHRYPDLPVVFWTASGVEELPELARTDPNTRIVRKVDGLAPLESALRWGLGAAGRELDRP